MFSLFLSLCLLVPYFPNTNSVIINKREGRLDGHLYHVIFYYMELMDPREFKYTLIKPEDWQSDFITMFTRYSLIKYAPSINFASVFPDRDVSSELLTLNRAYESYLNKIMEIYPYSDKISVMLEENKYLYNVWDNVRDCNTPHYYLHIRRTALLNLKRLLDKIDETWFIQGKLPPHVPLHRFAYIREVGP